MFRHFQISAVLLISGLVIIISAQAALAHTGASGIVKQRMDVMGLLGDHAKAVGAMLNGRSPFDREAVEQAADAFIRHGKEIPSLFPDTDHSRNAPVTEALPAIWTHWDEFVELADRFTEDSRAFSRVTEKSGSDDQETAVRLRTLRTAFFKTAKSCRACHERFRLDED